MKILQLVNRIPYPLNDGGNLGVHFYTKGFLEAGVQLSLLAMNTTRHWVNIKDLPEMYQQLDHFETVKVDNKVRAIPAFFNLFTAQSYNVSRFISKPFERQLINLLNKEDYDIIQLEGLFLMPYISVIRQYSRGKVVLRQHNVEYLIWERLAAAESSFFKKKYLQLLARRLKTFEQDSLDKVDLILPVSKTDRAFFKSMDTKTPMMIVPFGLNVDDIPFLPAASKPISLYHIGAMDWQPNLEAINFFLESIWPLLEQELPQLKFHLAGRNLNKDLLKGQNENLVIHGEVPDATDFEKDKSILVVPLLSGSGVRIKIFRAMAMGKAIVTTPIGIEGIEAKDGKEAMIATNAQEMADKIITLSKHPEKIEKMGHNARTFIKAHHDRKTMIKNLLIKYQKMI